MNQYEYWDRVRKEINHLDDSRTISMKQAKELLVHVVEMAIFELDLQQRRFDFAKMVIEKSVADGKQGGE